MNDFLKCLLIWLPAFALEPALGQSADTAAERSRLGNQRIYSEVEQREREEEQRLEQARLQEDTGARSTDAGIVDEIQPTTAPQEVRVAAPATSAEEVSRHDEPARNADVSKALEQLRTLGELRDAGYVTEEEFARIKQKILDARF